MTTVEQIDEIENQVLIMECRGATAKSIYELQDILEKIDQLRTDIRFKRKAYKNKRLHDEFFWDCESRLNNLKERAGNLLYELKERFYPVDSLLW